MKLSSLAMAMPEDDEGDAGDEEAADDSAGAFEEAAAEAFALAKKGDNAGAAAALRAAVESCVADYLAEE